MPYVLGFSLLLLLGGCFDRSQAKLVQGQLPPLQSGQVLLVNYWAKWCKPCKEEIPELNQLESIAAGVFVVGVDFDDHQGESLDKLIDKMGIEFPVLANLQQAVLLHPALKKPPKVLPSTYLIYYDKTGAKLEVKTFIGPQTEAGLLAEIAVVRAH